MTVRICLLEHWKFLLVVITPIVLLPLPLLVTDQKGTCGYMLLLMGVYWCTEALPLAVTGMIPVFLAPGFGILTTGAVCDNYLKSIVMMFTGGLIVAIAIETSNLHKRIALTVLRIIGTRPRSLMFGFMLPTWFLSMWISNTATTAMMLPIMEAVLEQLKHTEMDDEEPYNGHTIMGTENRGLELDDVNVNVKKRDIGTESDKSHNLNNMTNGKHSLAGTDNFTKIASYKTTADETSYVEDETGRNYTVSVVTENPATSENSGIDEKYKNICKGMTVAVAYAANVGGTATLTGTGPNTIMKGHADLVWQRNGFAESPVTYTSWFIYGFPIAVINFIFVYLWLLLFYLGLSAFKCKKEDPKREIAVKNVINSEYKKLGTICFHEVAAGGMFFILVLLWFFRAPGFMPGWADGFKEGYIGDAVPAILIACLLFAIPMKIPKIHKVESEGHAKAVLDWKTVHEKYPWSIIFLMGGGFALAEACEVSGLSQWIGNQLTVFEVLPGWLMTALICLIVAMLTEVTSNSATCTILMPIMEAMASSLCKNPLYLMFPTAIATSYAFMLPVATPPNAIAFSYGRITVLDMVKAGAILNVLCIFSVTLANETWGKAYFKLDEAPWPVCNVTNVTAVTVDYTTI